MAPVVEIGRLTANLDHAVDRGRAAQDLAARLCDFASLELRLRLRLEAPVEARMADHVHVADRNPGPDRTVVVAGFKQQHPGRRIGAEPIGQDAAGGPSSDNHVIEMLDVMDSHGVCVRRPRSLLCEVRTDGQAVRSPVREAAFCAASRPRVGGNWPNMLPTTVPGMHRRGISSCVSSGAAMSAWHIEQIDAPRERVN